jgi:hypothetical protein
MISEPMVRSSQTVHLYCIDSNTISKRTEIRFHMTHSPRSSNECVQHHFWADGTFDTTRAPFLCWDYHYLQTDSNKLPLEPCHLGVSSVASKMISEPMVCSAKIVHLYRTDTNTISKRTETRFHLTHSPRSSIRCIQDNFQPYGTFETNHAPILHQDYNYLLTDLKQASTWASSPQSIVGCVQNDFWAYGTFSANCAPRQD